MSKIGATLTNYGSQGLINRIRYQPSSSPPIFVLCDICYWCATFVDMTTVPIHNICPQCSANNNNSELTSFPILPNESFTFDYNDKRGVEFEFNGKFTYF